MPLSSDYSEKLRRARGHLEDLNTRNENFFKKDHYTAITEEDPEGGPNSFQVRVIADPPDKDFPVTAGDVLHNLRGTLDHLVYTMAVKAAAPKPISQDIAQNSEFPIIGDINAKGRAGSGSRMFKVARAVKLQGIPPKAQTIIEGLQPYTRGNDFKTHPLWALHELSNIDKHRTLLVGTMSNAAAMLLPDQSFNYTFIRDITPIYGVLLEPEAVIVRYAAVPTDPSQKMQVKFDPILHIVFNCRSSVDGENTLGVLFKIAEFVENQVIPPLKKFL